jgi:hypothetical protein
MVFGRLRWLALVGSLVLVAGSSGRAQERPVHLTGLINDHTTAAVGSWEIHGVWTLDLRGSSGRAGFAAALSMERSDYFFFVNPGEDPNAPASRNAHTHHLSMTDAIVTALTNGFRVSGPVTITGNGATPPFGTSSTLQVDVTGGDLVAYSNVALTFGGDGVKHFGPNPLAGVVSGTN